MPQGVGVLGALNSGAAVNVVMWVMYKCIVQVGTLSLRHLVRNAKSKAYSSYVWTTERRYTIFSDLYRPQFIILRAN